jgi:hypothetical protein
MSGLRYAWYAFWYLTRWIHGARMLAILAFGLFLMGGGILHLSRARLSETPVRLTLSEAMRLVEQPAPRLVSFAAELDFSRKIYWTESVPFWGPCPPDQTVSLPIPLPPGTDLVALVGCRVSVRGALNPTMAYRFTRATRGDDTAARPEQLTLAPIAGTKETLWVRSPDLRPGDAAEKDWLSGSDFEGVLAPRDRAVSAFPEGFPRRITSGPLARPGAFVIHGRGAGELDPRTREHFASHYWVPVEDTGNTLFVWATPALEQGHAGTVTGVLEPRERSDPRTRNKGYADFSVVTGEPLPARYGLIRYATAAEYNDAEVGVGWPFVLFGGLTAGAGLAGLVLYFMAPGLILRAWQRAVRSLGEPRSG